MGSGFRENHVLDNWKRIRRSDIEPCRVRIHRHRDKSYTQIELLLFRSRGCGCYNGYCEQLFHLDPLFQFAAERQCIPLPTDPKTLDNSQVRGTPEIDAVLCRPAGFPILEQLITLIGHFGLLLLSGGIFHAMYLVSEDGCRAREPSYSY